MNALAIHLYLTIRYINLSFNYFGNFYRIIVISDMLITTKSDTPTTGDGTPARVKALYT
jgi:hypothetical protein